MNAIEIKELTKDYGSVRAVNELSLNVRHGEVFGLLGVNGAGKTTTVKMLSCLARPTSGDALVYGKSVVSDAAAVKRMIGVSPQETAVAQMLTVRENLEFMCGVYGLGRVDAANKIKSLTDGFELSEVMDRRAGKLSGGWQRRLSIALSLVGEPSLVFLDEPTLGLDVIARAELHEIIRSLSKHSTVLLTTHYMEEAEALCDRIGIMKQGRLIALGTPSELKAQAGAENFETAFVTLIRRDSK